MPRRTDLGEDSKRPGRRRATGGRGQRNSGQAGEDGSGEGRAAHTCQFDTGVRRTCNTRYFAVKVNGGVASICSAAAL